MTRQGTEKEALRDPDPTAYGSIELGTVGWDGVDEHYSVENNGLTLVRVTLFRGHVVASDGEKKAGGARGQQLLCQLSAPLWYIPDPGTVVHVSIPAGFWSTPGAAMIVAVASKSPAGQWASNKGKDAILDFGPDRRVIIKAGGGVVLSDYENRYVGVSPEMGFKVGDADASGCCLKSGTWSFYAVDAGEAKAVIEASAFAGIRFAFKDGTGPHGITIGGGAVIPFGTKFQLQTAMALLSPAASPATPLMVGPAPGHPSTTLFGL